MSEHKALEILRAAEAERLKAQGPQEPPLTWNQLMRQKGHPELATEPEDAPDDPVARDRALQQERQARMENEEAQRKSESKSAQRRKRAQKQDSARAPTEVFTSMDQIGIAEGDPPVDLSVPSDLGDPGDDHDSEPTEP